MTVAPSELAQSLLARARTRRHRDEQDAHACRERVHFTVPRLRGRFGFGRVWLIGSLAWGGFGERSDVDLVVEHLPAEAASLLADLLADATGRHVDLLLLDSLPASFRRRILDEGTDVA